MATSPTSSSFAQSRAKKVSPILLLFLSSLPSILSSSSSSQISYPNHCNSIVPQSTPTASLFSSSASFELSNGYFSGGDELLGDDPNATFFNPRFFYFRPRSIRQTLTPGTLYLDGTLAFHGGGIRVGRRNLTAARPRFRNVRPRNPRVFNRRGRVSFDLQGFWSELNGKLCMVGIGIGRSKEGIALQLSSVFKLNYPNVSNISTSVVTGVVESLDSTDSLNHFSPISILAYAQKKYEFTLIPDALKSCSVAKIQEQSLGFNRNSTCLYLDPLLSRQFKLDYKKNPFAQSFGFSPSIMSLNQVRCSENGGLRMFIVFTNRSNIGFNTFVEPDKILVSEGAWDQENNRLCLVACRVINVKDSLLGKPVDDCTIRLSLWFPSVMSIEKRSVVVGRMWSDQNEKDFGYFDMASFVSKESSVYARPGLKYEYTKLDDVKKFCTKGDPQKAGKGRYPDMTSIGDMRFHMYVRHPVGKISRGYANLLSVGETIFGNSLAEIPGSYLPVQQVVDAKHSIWNVSYQISYSYLNSSVYVPAEISAEGIYNSRTGILCMVGCRHVDSYLDCGILINIQLAPLNSKAEEHLKGTIRSIREKSDPLFFDTLDISAYGMYKTQAVESIWLMDIEITMVLTSLTFSCVFIGLQLFHIKKHPDVLPSISIMMLVMLTLGHMIPLVLNFEALFFRHQNRQNVLLWSGGWLEVNEVIVRVMTMVAFLLQFRFLQVAWSSRSTEDIKKGLWVAERKTVSLCLPFYIVGGLIALLVHLRSRGNAHSLWEDLMSYAGLTLDGFLFPQFIFNIFWNSKDKSLAPSFYVGTTVVRAFPHVYDAYRARHYVPHLNSSYIYANPIGDFYSSAWDIIIPCAGVLFAVLIYLQQRFGGASILPRRIKEAGEYEMVPIDSH